MRKIKFILRFIYSAVYAIVKKFIINVYKLRLKSYLPYSQGIYGKEDSLNSSSIIYLRLTSCRL